MKSFLYSIQIILSTTLTILFYSSTAFAAVLQTNMPASYVLGRSDFTSSGIISWTTSSIGSPNAMTLDETNHRLFVADGARILVFDVSGTVSNNMSAVHVIGQINFTDSASQLDDAHVNSTQGLAYDPNHNYLFVADNKYHRVLVFDVTTITDGEPAMYVLGQDDFISGSSCKGGSINTLGQSCFQTPTDLFFDPVTNYLYVSDDLQRVLVYDTSSGISNGMNASYVLGQPDFLTGNSSLGLIAAGVNYPRGITFDPINHLLFVASNSQSRILVFDISSGLTNGMNASYVLGQPDFSTGNSFTTQDGMATPHGLWFDKQEKRLFVTDQTNNRVLVYDTSSGISNGMNASYVLGQPDFLTATPNSQGEVISGPKGNTYYPCSQCLSSPESVVYSSANRLLFIGDGNGRVLVFDLSLQQGNISYSGSFNESVNDDGSLTGSRTATLTNDTFINAGGTLTYPTHYTITNMPPGLTPIMTVSGDGTQATLTFTGNVSAGKHGVSDSINQLGITFLDGAFTLNSTAANVTGYTNETGVITFITNTETSSPTPVSGGVIPIGCTDKTAINFSPNVVINSGCIYSNNTATPPSVATSIKKYTFTKVLRLGMNDPEVSYLQQYLNNYGFLVAQSGAGSSGNETNYFGMRTAQALKKFQEANASVILKPYGLTRGTGYFGNQTMQFMNSN